MRFHNALAAALVSLGVSHPTAELVAFVVALAPTAIVAWSPFVALAFAPRRGHGADWLVCVGRAEVSE